MNCKQFQSYISRFFAEELNVDETEAFLAHVASCKECKEELEIMHLLAVGLPQLDGDVKEETYDFKGILMNKLSIANKYCKKVRRTEKLRNAFVIVVNITALIGMLYQAFMIFGGEEWLANYF